jgi:PAS domain S-box-containing protein
MELGSITGAQGRYLDEQGRTLRGILLAGAVVLAGMVASAPLMRIPLEVAFLVYGTGLVLHLGHLAALRRLPARAVAVSHCFTYLVWVTGILALRTGGLRAPAALVYPPIVLVSGLVWSGRAALGVALAGSLAGLALVLLEHAHLLPPAAEQVSPLRLWFVMTACMVITAVLLRFALGIIHRSAVEALQNQRELADLVRAAPDAMLFVRPDRVVRACNPAAQQLAGRSADGLVGKRLDEIAGVNDGERGRLARHLEEAAAGRPEPPIELGLPHADGSVVPVELRARRAAHGRNPEVHVTMVDLRDRVKAERERRRLEEQLRQAQRLEALGRMAGGVAHDINNILTIILGNTELIPRGVPGVSENLQEIDAAARRAAELTSQLLAFGRRQVFTPELCDAGAVVAGLERMVRRLLPEDIALALELAPAPLLVYADRVQLEQVLMNLVANARDALPHGGTITVSVAGVPPAFAAVDVPADAVWITVADDGVGMTEEVREHAFEPFFTTKEVGRGTGLGLATVHGIVTQSGGRIFLDSREGRGTSFAVAFPRAAPAAAVAAPPAVPAAGLRRPATILVVEDDPAVRQVARAMLSGGGYRVLVAASGAEARAASDGFAGPIDLLLTDVVMAGPSGLALAADISARRPEIRTLYTSGHAEELIARRGSLQPGAHFLAKPYTRATLLEKVAHILAAPEASAIGAR